MFVGVFSPDTMLLLYPHQLSSPIGHKACCGFSSVDSLWKYVAQMDLDISATDFLTFLLMASHNIFAVEFLHQLAFLIQISIYCLTAWWILNCSLGLSVLLPSSFGRGRCTLVFQQEIHRRICLILEPLRNPFEFPSPTY
ncbi:hypothetical protein TNCV_3763151 [Trichonephila clavipes]|uniref:Uncharacterized protein n=1 Tax=Trichonephila clavipes TaxID=2585209 RepID=A0A8X6VV92_TRICX|nr:hypothetical protein TNCV_3763151 [Trichonephila clavipes]